jgi:hypothetical protein
VLLIITDRTRASFLKTVATAAHTTFWPLLGELTNMPPSMPPGSSQPQQQQQQQQSQPSSQQSFSMSQPSSQPTGYRQYADMPQKPPSDPDMGIYSVRAQLMSWFPGVLLTLSV